MQSCKLLNNKIPVCLLVAENGGQTSHFWPTVKFGEETTDLYKYSIQMPYLLFTPYHIM